MSFNIKCPECNEQIEIDSPGRHAHINCYCSSYSYCRTIDYEVCIDEKTCSGCRGCWYREDDESDYCDQNWTDRLCSGKDSCDVFDNPDVCDEAALCTYFYFHPVWHKIIHCPYCGSFDVNEGAKGNVWELHCLYCDKDFSLKEKSNNNTNSAKEKVKLEERRIQLIREYKSLLDEGLISNEEYTRKRNEIMNAIRF